MCYHLFISIIDSFVYFNHLHVVHVFMCPFVNLPIHLSTNPSYLPHLHIPLLRPKGDIEVET